MRNTPRCEVIILVLAAAMAALAGPVRAQETESLPDAVKVTPYERAGGNVTPRYDETVAYCRVLADASPKVHFTSFGVSPRGRKLPLLIVDAKGRFTPEAARADGNVILLVEACIHAGECCGKDAGLMWIRDFTVGGRFALPHGVTILFIPIFNVDGHERFGPYNRANQNGPEEMGWRTTAQNLNLNRDFLKADAPEMRAWLKLFTTWMPDFFVDIHSTDGADYQYPVTYGLAIHGNMAPSITAWTKDYLERTEIHMAAAGHPMCPYVTFRSWHDPRSGMVLGVAGPRYSQGYAAVQNRPGLLVETHMLKPYPVRVEATRVLLERTLAHLAEERKSLGRAVAAADAFTASEAFRKAPFAMSYRNTDQATKRRFLGVEYEVVKSDLTGGEWVKYSDRPATFEIDYYDEVVPDVTVKLPQAYLVPPEWTGVIERLALHGVEMRPLPTPQRIEVRSYRILNPRFEAERPWHTLPYEGRTWCASILRRSGGPASSRRAR